MSTGKKGFEERVLKTDRRRSIGSVTEIERTI